MDAPVSQALAAGDNTDVCTIEHGKDAIRVNPCGSEGGQRDGASLSPRHLRLLFLARIVRRVAIVDAARPDELHLHNRLLIAGPHKMRVLGRLRIQGARL
jgi:hypothetical protein